MVEAVVAVALVLIIFLFILFVKVHNELGKVRDRLESLDSGAFVKWNELKEVKIAQSIRDGVVADEIEIDEEAKRKNMNTPNDHKGPFRLVLPDAINSSEAMILLRWIKCYGYFYNRLSVSELPIEMRDWFVSGEPDLKSHVTRITPV